MKSTVEKAQKPENKISAEVAAYLASRPENYYIPANGTSKMASEGHMASCTKCKRKILVSIGLFGVSHHTGLTVICADCLKVDEQFAQTYPEIAKRIEEWKKD